MEANIKQALTPFTKNEALLRALFLVSFSDVVRNPCDLTFLNRSATSRIWTTFTHPILTLVS
jgi:hypothetical protein